MSMFDNEIQTPVLTINKNNRGDKIIIKSIKDKDTDNIKAVDIRQYFTNDNDELCFTKKGLRIPIDNLREVTEALASLIED